MKRWLRCVMLKCKFLVCNIKDSRRLSTNTFAHFYSLKNIFSRLLCDFVLPLSLKLGIRVPCKIFNKMLYKIGQCDDRSQFYWFQFNHQKAGLKKRKEIKWNRFQCQWWKRLFPELGMEKPLEKSEFQLMNMRWRW